MEVLRLVPVDVWVELQESCHLSPDVDRALGIWCNAADNCLFQAYKEAGGPCPQGDPLFLGRGKVVIRTRLVGGRVPARIHGSAKADEVDSISCHAFINSSLAP